MNKLLVISSLFIFAFFGCQDNNSVIEPDLTSDQQTSMIKVGNEYVSWISLPEAFNKAMKKDVVVGDTVVGAEGALLAIDDSYEGGIFGTVTIDATLEFLPGAFTDTRYITMTVNDEFGEGTFTPHGEFDMPAIYNIIIQGVDLSSVDPTAVDFVYMAEDGTYEYVENDDISVDQTTGTLQIVNAQLPHFSRYGFTN